MHCLHFTVVGSALQIVRALPGDTEPVTAVAVSPDDDTIVTASRSRLLRVYDWTTATCRRSFKAHDAPTMAMQYHRSGTLLATGSSDATVKVRRLTSLTCQVGSV
jgi:U3 small nucleolar RNA-associated protein 13